jgi:NAD(P)-dependent dehydrogenase (short-subunit alcohol dehydrogenase family)
MNPKESSLLLQNKTAVVYGAAGAIGGAVARAFAREGARVFLTGRRLASVKAVAHEITEAGGAATAAEVDALDERAIDQHLQSVVAAAGAVDVSFNAVGVPNAKILGVPFTELDVGQYALPIAAYTRSYFLTSRLAARRMIPKKSGVILTLSAIPGRAGTPLNGGYGPAMAAKEALTRDLSAELAPHGLRVVCLRAHGLPETPMIKGLFELKGRPAGMSWDQFQTYLANWGHARRTMRLDEVTAMAAFLASDRASGLTGTTVNLTMGGVAD